MPSILAPGSYSLTGVVSASGIASLNFGTSGRVGSIRVHLGQVVRKGEVLATEAAAASTADVRAGRAAITADKANLAALQADGSAAASITAAQAGASQEGRPDTATPRAVMLAGLSTNPPGAKVTSRRLSAAIHVTRGVVDDYWLNIPGRGPRCPTCNPPRPDVGQVALRAVL